MKIVKSWLKEMVREAVCSALNEAYDDGDHNLRQDMEQNDVINMLKQAKMPLITRNKMDQIIAALEKKSNLRKGLASPKNKSKISGAIAAGQFVQLADALERIVVRSSALV